MAAPKWIAPWVVLLLGLSILSACGTARHEDLSARTGWEPIHTQGDVTIEFFGEGEDTYEVRWSRGSLHRSTSQRITPTGGGEPAHLWWESTQFVVLRQGCGSPCWFAIVLPLDPQEPDRLYLYPMAYDRQRNLLAYLGDDVRSVVAENLVTHKTLTVPLTPMCSSLFPGWCIDDPTFLEDSIHLRWCIGEVRHGACSDAREMNVPLTGIVARSFRDAVANPSPRPTHEQER